MRLRRFDAAWAELQLLPQLWFKGFSIDGVLLVKEGEPAWPNNSMQRTALRVAADAGDERDVL